MLPTAPPRVPCRYNPLRCVLTTRHAFHRDARQRGLGKGQPNRETANRRTPLASSKRPGRGDTLHDRQQEYHSTSLIYYIFEGLSRNMCVMSVLLF